jgi:hypothetical protein
MSERELSKTFFWHLHAPLRAPLSASFTCANASTGHRFVTRDVEVFMHAWSKQYGVYIQGKNLSYAYDALSKVFIENIWK